jgi:hypothetical protein
MSGFEEFTQAVATSVKPARPNAVPTLDRVAILGGGSDACLLAALCLSEGAEVSLFSAYGAELETLRTSSGISLRGTGPVGTYHVDRARGPSVQLSTEIDRVVAEAQVIFLTGPIHKYRTYAMVLADHLRDGQIIVLPEGRSLGALEASWLLRIGGCSADFTLVEMQGLPFWAAAEGAVQILSERGAVPAATLPSGRSDVIEALRRFMPNLTALDSVLESGFADGSALVELPLLMLASDTTPLPMGAVALAENDTFAARLGDTQRQTIHALAEERRRVGAAFGVRNLPSADDWIAAYAGAARGDAARPMPTVFEPILRDGVIGSLAPLMSAAALTGTPVPVTQAMVTLASTVLSADVASAGRRLETIGITAGDVDSARKTMDTIARGQR